MRVPRRWYNDFDSEDEANERFFEMQRQREDWDRSQRQWEQSRQSTPVTDAVKPHQQIVAELKAKLDAIKAESATPSQESTAATTTLLRQ